jgi:hypothetical protein
MQFDSIAIQAVDDDVDDGRGGQVMYRKDSQPKADPTNH